MKKFFIILCGILIMGDAVARIMFTPQSVNHNIASAWKSGGIYENELTDEYPKLAEQLNNETGTFGTDEGAIVLVMARKIYDNGGEFCATQIQAANINGRRYIWIDYIKDDKFFCNTVCKPGFFGANCSKSSGVVAVNNNKLNFGTFDVITSGKETNIITEETQVLSSINRKKSDIRTAAHVVLGMVKLLDHGMIVAPIEIVAERDLTGSGGIHSRIISAKSNGGNTLLCRAGYYANADETDCVSRAQHVTETLCDGFDGYNETVHTKYTPSGSSCSKFFCSQSGYGFKSQNDKTCVECAGGALAYIKDDGTCGICTKGKIANETRDDCLDESDVKQYSKDKMKSNGNRQCWLETDGRKFAGCVNVCPGTTPCYIDGKCKACD